MRKLPLVAAVLMLSVPLHAQGPFFRFGRTGSGEGVSFEYGTDFEYFFENREFDAYLSRYSGPEVPLPLESCTVHGLVLTPSVGFSLFQGASANHRLALGLDIRRNMGSGPVTWQALEELTVHYDAHVTLPDGSMFEGVLGVFPNRFREGEYGNAFFSPVTLFSDRNMDGLLLKYRAQRFRAEIGADWMGMKTESSRERFMIVSAGNWKPLGWLDAGWAGTFYHYAGSETVHGVVDNNLLGLYARVNLAGRTGLQELSLKLSGLFSYQWDRKAEASQSFPMGVEALAVVRSHDVYLSNCSYAGDNLQYLYGHTDSGGFAYGNSLYFGDPFYQCRFWDRVELGWEPDISDFISLNVNFQFHFGEGGFLGWMQRLGFVFDLDRIRHRGWGAGRTGEASRPSRRRSDAPVLFM